MVLTPKLRQASKSQQLYKINEFPKGFAHTVAKEIFLIKATSLFSSDKVDVQGDVWEQIFANAIGANRDSAIALGLDDIQDAETSTAWGAKTVKWGKRSDISPAILSGNAKVNLISGRNSPEYSFNRSVDPSRDDPSEIAEFVLAIWNQRVSEVRTKFKNIRTVVMVKCASLKRVIIFEKETEFFQFQDYTWAWNSNKNLIGSFDDVIKFTWQPHGSQFTVKNVIIPQEAIIIDIAEPSEFPREELLALSGWGHDKYSAFKVSERY